jgi:hypothetical protein
MAITLKGIRLESLNIVRSKESGNLELNQSSYALISSTDKVLANQSIGAYGGVTINASPDTLALLEKFIQSYKKDITTMLGLEEG